MTKIRGNFLWIVVLSAFVAALIGLGYSIYYETKSYNIDFLPDIGTPADYFGVLGTMLTILVSWQQMKKLEENARKESYETRKKLQTSQDQFDKTIDEMQKEREEAYKPDIYMDTEEKVYSISKGSNNMNLILGDKELAIINVDVGTAKNIVIEAYSNKNLANLEKYAKQSFILPKYDNTIIYSLMYVGNFVDEIKPLNGGYLFSKEKLHICVSEIYKKILRDYIFELNDKKDEIKGDPFTDLPKFTYIITYQDQEEIKYSKEVIIYAKCWDIKPDKCKVTLSVENKPAHKI